MEERIRVTGKQNEWIKQNNGENNHQTLFTTKCLISSNLEVLPEVTGGGGGTQSI